MRDLLSSFKINEYMKITFIQGGGTIDKDYPQGENHHGYEFKIDEPAFNSIFKKVNLEFEYEIIKVLKKDSLDITEDDRVKLYEIINDTKNDKIIITHGTDTIYQTAKVLSSLKGKTIVLTGAVLPEKFRDSDAMFNVGVAIGAVNLLKNGVYIALNGQVVPYKKYQNDTINDH